jgi:hypothetical protein
MAWRRSSVWMVVVNDQHTCDAIALEDTEVCVMPFATASRSFHARSMACSAMCTEIM